MNSLIENTLDVHGIERLRDFALTGLVQSAAVEYFAELILEDSREENFNLSQEIIRLRGQVTYLQEEVATLEDQVFILKISLDYARNIEV